MPHTRVAIKLVEFCALSHIRVEFSVPTMGLGVITNDANNPVISLTLPEEPQPLN